MWYAVFILSWKVKAIIKREIHPISALILIDVKIIQVDIRYVGKGDLAEIDRKTLATSHNTFISQDYKRIHAEQQSA
jgi:hypothetical protein